MNDTCSCYTDYMRKTFLFMMVSLDGFFEGINHDLSWHNTDQEFIDFADNQLDETDTLIFGHKTYEIMAEYWQSPEALKEDGSTAIRMNKLSKVVFSHSHFDTAWNNTVVSTDVVQKIQELKRQDGKKIAILGSSHLGKDMIEAGLVDEIRIMVNPVFLGAGSTLFEGLTKKMALRGSRIFSNGNVLLNYLPENI